MRLVPARLGLFDDVFDGMFNDKFFRSNTSVMKTDIKEKDGNYLFDIELPGYKKEDIQLTLEDGYLNIQATHNSDNSEKDDAGNVIRRERSYGTCSRSFYVGEAVSEEDIKAKYENGELKLVIPKKEPQPEVETKKSIMIE